MENNLDSLAEDIRYWYLRRKKHHRSTYVLPDKAHLEDFFKAAEICADLNADACEFVDAQFYQSDPDKLLPQFLHSKLAFAKYNKYRNEHQCDPAELFEVYKEKLKRQLLLGRKLDWILSTADFDFPAWFRICITKEPDPALIKAFKEKALEELTPKIKQFLIDNNLDYKRITL